MASRLDITLKNGAQAGDAERTDAKRKLQIIVDSMVAPRSLLVTDEGSFVRVEFPDDVASEQPQACFRAAVNLAGLPETPFEAGSPRLETLTGDDLRSPEQYVYSV